jgi:hypothetical protein
MNGEIVLSDTVVVALITAFFRATLELLWVSS